MTARLMDQFNGIQTYAGETSGSETWVALAIW